MRGLGRTQWTDSGTLARIGMFLHVAGLHRHLYSLFSSFPGPLKPQITKMSKLRDRCGLEGGGARRWFDVHEERKSMLLVNLFPSFPLAYIFSDFRWTLNKLDVRCAGRAVAVRAVYVSRLWLCIEFAERVFCPHCPGEM